MLSTIKTKLVAIFSLIFLLWGVATWVAIHNLGLANDAYRQTMDVDVENLMAIEDIVAHKKDVRNSVARILLLPETATEAEDARLMEVLKGHVAEVERLIALLQGRVTDPELLRRVNEFNDIHLVAFPLQMRMVTMDKAGDRAGAAQLFLTDGQDIADRIDESLEGMRDYVRDAAHATEARTFDAYGLARIEMLALVGVSALVVLVAAWLIMARLSRGLSASVGMARAIAAGDLSAEAEVSGRDEITALLVAQRQMAAKLREVMAEVSGAARSVATGASQIAASSEELSRGSTEQSGATEEASSAVAQMAANIGQSADNATVTEKIAVKSAEDAAASGLFELQAAQLAATKATDPAVKRYATQLADHHGAANSELMSLANSLGLELPPGPKRAMRNEIEKLGKKTGPEFDREFVQNVGVKEHEKDIKAFQKAAKDVKDPQLKAWIDKTLPVLQQHLSAAQKLPQAGSEAAASTRTQQQRMGSGGSSGGSSGGGSGGGSPGSGR